MFTYGHAWLVPNGTHNADFSKKATAMALTIASVEETSLIKRHLQIALLKLMSLIQKRLVTTTNSCNPRSAHTSAITQTLQNSNVLDVVQSIDPMLWAKDKLKMRFKKRWELKKTSESY